MDEAHVEHAIGFVENQHFDLIEAQRALIDQIHQAAGRSDQNFDAARERAFLRYDRYAADGERDVERADVAAIGAEAVASLSGQFARRRQHQHAAGFLRRAQPLGVEVIDDRQREGRGLAGAGLRDADDIARLHDEGNCLGLDRSGSEVFFFREGAEDRLCEAEIVK